MLTVAKIKVPQGKVQSTLPSTFALMLGLLVHGALLPCRLGLVRMATAMNALTNRALAMINNILRRFELVPRIPSCRIIAMSV